MATTESDIIRDEQERSNLLRTIADVETAIAVSTPGTRRVLENTLENVKKRVVVLDKKIEEGKVERHTIEQAVMTIAALAANETALNAREREEYTGFLKEDFFTKKDFGRLAQFYGHTWDRLSEDGKDQMSHRVWEGIRHHEYRFDDLPKEVKEKEAKLAYRKLSASTLDSDAKNIPASDRDEFLKAYRANDQNAASHILDRDSFKQYMSSKPGTGAKHQSATNARTIDDDKILADEPSPTTAPSEFSAMSKIKQGVSALQNVTLSDTVSNPSVAALPNASAPAVSGRFHV